MADHSVSLFFPLRVLSVKSWMCIYLYMLIWSSCFNTSVTGQKLIGSQPVLATVGEDVILPCRIEPAVNMERKSVKWTRPDLEPENVYFLEYGIVKPILQNPLYSQRAFLFHKELHLGNISLNLFSVQFSDEGKYTCFAPYLAISIEIQLRVGNVSQPVISSNGHTDGGLSLSCYSGCWYPQPEISWLDGDGNLLPAGPSVTENRSDHCYNVQRDVTVRGEGHVICRVYLPHFKHTVHTHHYFSGFMEGSTSGNLRAFIAGFFTAIFFILVAAALIYMYFCWKNKLNPVSQLIGQHRDPLI